MTQETVKTIAYAATFLLGFGALIGYFIFRINYRQRHIEHDQEELELDEIEEVFH